VPSVLPSDRLRNAARTTADATLTHECAAGVAERLRVSARTHSSTMAAECVAVLAACIARLTAAHRVTLDVSAALRAAVLGDDLVAADLRDDVRLSVDSSNEPDLRVMTERIRKAMLLATDLASADENQTRGITLTLGAESGAWGNGEWNLALTIDSTAVRFGVTYASSLFDDATVQRYLDCMERMLDGALAEPRRALARLPLLSEREHTLLLRTWNATDVVWPDAQLVHQLIDAQGARTPTAIAVESDGALFTYANLSLASDALADRLTAAGVGVGSIVAICCTRSHELIVALVAILKSGAAFLPIDADLPRERIRLKLEDTGCHMLLAHTVLVALMEATADGLPVAVHAIPDAAELARVRSMASALPTVDESQRAYVMYTSGSTGRPKGVQIAHRSLANHAQWFASRVGLSGADRVLLQASLSFDAAIAEIFAPLTAGATVVCAPPNSQRDLRALPLLLHELGITVVQMVPSALRIAAEQGGFAGSRSLRFLVSGGEVLDPALAARVLRQRPTLRLGNFYGPTEVTVDATSCDVTVPVDESQPLTIGFPVANARCRILDPLGGLVPVGVPGELHIGGVGLAIGYLNLPDRTAARFSDDPFVPGERLYHTGDLARYRADGAIEYLGRIDSQVKLRGYRIEMAEIEAALQSHPRVQQAAVIVADDAAGDQQLVAYVVPDPKLPPTEAELRQIARVRLPAFMVPSAFVMLDALPAMSNGKLDRRALPLPPIVVPDATDAALLDDPLEQALQAIWERTLGVRPIGPDDDFFALGGHSLKAIRLLAEIDAAHGMTLRTATLFEAPTIRMLAARMREGVPRDVSTLIPVQPRGTRPPLFFAPGGGGELFVFEPLARAFGVEQPLYVLDMYVFEEPRGDGRELTLADVAARMIADIRRVQPRGPYQVAGYSLGGNIVFEIAQQLTRDGDEVQLVALIDCDGPNYPIMQPALTRAAMHLRHSVSLGPRGTFRYLRRRFGNLVRSAGAAPEPELNLFANEAETPLVPAHVIEGMERALLPVLKAWERYVPRFYGGTVLLVRADERPFMIGVIDEDLFLGWAPYVGRIQTASIAGNHLDIVNPANADRLAGILQRYLLA
jgi:amino acid adenylation domain-containing protein